MNRKQQGAGIGSRKGGRMELFHMTDIIPLLGLPYPPAGRGDYNIPCPCCDDTPGKKHLNINLRRDVFRCPRCGFSGGVFDLYAHYTGLPRESVRDALVARLDVRGRFPAKPKPPPPPEFPETPLTDIGARSATYEAFLKLLSLASDHKGNLLSRGLPEDRIGALGYRTTPVAGMTAIAKRLLADGYSLSGVPGFYRKEGQWTFLAENRGILIPVRDLQGRIQGLQIRRDHVEKRKFRWVSSAGKPDGCKAEAWTHLSGPPRETILLIEGPLKADIVHELTGQTALAVAGVNSLSHLEQQLAELRKLGVRKIMTAFDMDFLQNPHVQNGYRRLTEILQASGFRYGTYVWDPRYNGLDDYIWKGCMGHPK